MMLYQICFYISFLLSILTVFIFACTIKKVDRFRNWNGIYVLFVGTFLAIIPIIIPTYIDVLKVKIPDAIFLIIHNTIQVFLWNADYEMLVSFAEMIQPLVLQQVCMTLGSLLILIAPLITLGFLISFFGKVMANLSFWFAKNFGKREIYIFSKLNRESLITAKDIDRKKKGIIVFCDVSDKDELSNSELVDSAEKISAVLLSKSITELVLNTKKKVYFFFIDKDEGNNLEATLSMVERYKGMENINMYVMAESDASEVILDNVSKEIRNLRRINRTRSIVYSHIITHSMFENTREEGGEKIISYLIVGAGSLGVEMLKAAIWCGQMQGYRIEICLVDKLDGIATKLKASYPELLCQNNYQIEIFESMDVDSYEFQKLLLEKISPTHVFISLGNDTKNIDVAMQIRRLAQRKGRLSKEEKSPEVYAVVKNDSLKNVIMNEADNLLKIICIGNDKEQYRLENITNQELDKMGFVVHQAYSSIHKKTNEAEKTSKQIKEEYDGCEYNRRSSIVTGIHTAYKKRLQLKNDEKLAELEHRRWNAYIRTEGYIKWDKTVYSQADCNETKDSLAKIHSNLVSYDELDENTKKNDIAILNELYKNDKVDLEYLQKKLNDK